MYLQQSKEIISVTHGHSWYLNNCLPLSTPNSLSPQQDFRGSWFFARWRDPYLHPRRVRITRIPSWTVTVFSLLSP